MSSGKRDVSKYVQGHMDEKKEISIFGMEEHSCIDCPFFRTLSGNFTYGWGEKVSMRGSILAKEIKGECFHAPPVPIKHSYRTRSSMSFAEITAVERLNLRPQVTAKDFCSVVVENKEN